MPFDFAPSICSIPDTASYGATIDRTSWPQRAFVRLAVRLLCEAHDLQPHVIWVYRLSAPGSATTGPEAPVTDVRLGRCARFVARRAAAGEGRGGRGSSPARPRSGGARAPRGL